MHDTTAQPDTASRPQAGRGGARLNYLPGLDGLRAIAVTAVLLYHADLPWIPGGYLGVEVFFALSGYLITSLLVAEWRAHGRIDFGAFWGRRARRLLPALFLLLAAALTFNVLFLPGEAGSIRGDALAATFYVTNWYQVFAHKSYFEIMGRPPMLQHLWSLAVEEQFYLLWPLLFAGLARRWRLNRGVFVAVLLGALASAGVMALLYQPDLDPSRLYYGTDTRASGLLLGCALALAWTPASGSLVAKWWHRAISVLADLAGLAALAVLGVLFVRLDETQPFLYQGGFAVCAVATLVLVSICAGRWGRLVPSLLGLAPLRWIGTRSYGIYLWHWPIFVVTRPQLDVPLDGAPLLVLRLGATLLLAELSYRFVETPIRRGALGRAVQTLRASSGAERRQLALRWGVSGLAAAVFAGGLIFSLGTAAPPAVPSYLSDSSTSSVASADPSQAAQASGSTPSPEVALVATPVPATATAASQPTFSPVPATQAPSLTAVLAAVSPSAVALAVSPVPAATNTAVAPPSPTRAAPSPTRKAPPTKPAARTPTPTVPRPATSTPTELVLPATNPPTPGEPGVPSPSPSPSAEPEGTAVALAGTPDASGGSAASVLDPPSSGPTEAATPPPVPAQPVAVRVLAIGDSVMLGSAAQLRLQIPNITVDAVVGRQASEAVNLLRWRASVNRLADVVVVHMGTNGYFTAKQFDDMMKALAGIRRVVFVNDKVPRRWESYNNAVIAAGVQRYPNAVLVDWYDATANQPALFSKDGTHPQVVGQRLYARMILEGINRP